MTEVLRIPKLNDRDVIRAFKSVAKKFGSSPVFGDALGSLSDEDVEQFSKLAGFNLHSARITAGQAHWVWNRQRDQPLDGFDTLQISWNNQTPPERSFLAEGSSSLTSALLRPLASVADPRASEVLNSHGNVLQAMESVAAKVIEDVATQQRDLQESYREEEARLYERVETQRQKDKDQIAADRQRMEEEIAERAAALDNRQAELDRTKKSLDDRNNTHVRRQIRESLLAMTKDRLENFALSSATRNQYRIVNLIAISGVIALGGASIYYGARIAVPDVANQQTWYVMLAKASVFAVTAVGLGYWFLGWHNRWLQRLADAEFKLQQFRLDIERASWLAETVLEWKQASEAPIPELLVTRLSAGLFHSDHSESDDPKVPAAHLAEALLGAAASAKLRMGEQELQLDRRGIKSLQSEKTA